MKRRNIILWITGIWISLMVAVFAISHANKDIWDINAEELMKSFTVISGNSEINDLSQWTPFEWDTLYSFAPYTSKEKIYEVVGYKWDKITESVNEGMNQIVFLKAGKVVCYLYGYPENIKISFNFGSYKSSFIKLSAEDKLSFRTTISDNGVRYFNYIE